MLLQCPHGYRTPGAIKSACRLQPNQHAGRHGNQNTLAENATCRERLSTITPSSANSIRCRIRRFRTKSTHCANAIRRRSQPTVSGASERVFPVQVSAQTIACTTLPEWIHNRLAAIECNSLQPQLVPACSAMSNPAAGKLWHQRQIRLPLLHSVSVRLLIRGRRWYMFGNPFLLLVDASVSVMP